MHLISDIESFDSNGTIATLGFFDGVHKGHRFLIEQVKAEAAKSGYQSLAVTFDKHPRMVLKQDFQPKLLNTLPEKIELLAKTGIDACCVLPFTKELAALTSEEFLQLLHKKLHVKKLIIGYDHRFGRNRENSFTQYKEYGEILGMEVEQSMPYVENDVTISSSVIRHLLEEGNVKEANEFLGYNYFLSGAVVHGKKIGRSIHFPTANIAVDESKEIPMPGVYAVHVEVAGQRYNGMLNVGSRPTIDEKDRTVTVEVNIFDFNKEIYGETIRLFFVQRVRDEQKFSSIVQLTEQLKKDEQYIRILLSFPVSSDLQSDDVLI